MKIRSILFILICQFLTSLVFSQNVVIVIIDGARYSETFGDPDHTFIPKMAELATKGTYINTFYNDGDTWTSHAVPALWCGTWAGVIQYNSTQYTVMPSLFEYYRKQKNAPDKDAIYELTYVPNLWLQSFHTDYGENYWPYTVSQGSTDNEVCTNTISDMETYQPRLTWVYFPNVDHEGHSGDYKNYVNAIKNADQLVGDLWNFIQTDDYYKNNTIMLVTNDHGRHTTDFSGHGDGCDGCRHIMFLALGPNIKQNYVSNTYRTTTDFAVTAAYILGVNPEYATGSPITEIFQTIDLKPISKYNKFEITKNELKISIEYNTFAEIKIIDSQGKIIDKIKSQLYKGENIITWNNKNLKGLYIVTLKSLEFSKNFKIIL